MLQIVTISLPFSLYALTMSTIPFFHRLTIIGAAALVLAGWACSTQAANIFEVAQIVPLSGPMAYVGKEITAITQATLGDANDSSQETRFVLKTYDDSYIEKTAAATALHATKTSQVLLSCFGTASCLAQQRVSSAVGVPLIGPIAGAAELRNKEAMGVYPVRASAAQEISRLLSFADTSGLHVIGVLIQYDEFGLAYARELDRIAAQPRYQHLTVVRTILTSATPDYAGAAARMQIRRPAVNALLMIANGIHSSAFLKAWSLQQKLPFVLNLAGQASANFSNTIKDYVKIAAFVTVTPSPWGRKLEVQRDYQRIAKRAGISPSYLGFESYLNARALIEAVKRSKANGKTDLLRWLEGGVALNLGGYYLKWIGSNEGSIFTDLAMLLQDGTYKH